MVIINSFVYPESNIRFQQRNIRVILDKNDLGLGQLYLSEKNMSWQLNESQGFTISYENITLHAVSKDLNVYPKECIYIITDEELTMPGLRTLENAEDSSDEDTPASPISEILLVPEGEEVSHADTIKAIYETMKLCQELNPDPADAFDGDEDDHLYEDAEEEMDEAEYEINDRGGGDADINEISRRIETNSLNVQYDYTNGSANDDEDFQDAD